MEIIKKTYAGRRFPSVGKAAALLESIDECM